MKWNRTSNRSFEGLGEEEQQHFVSPFFFAQLSDPQLGFMEENVSWDEEIRLAKLAVETINRLKPRFAIICGDLVHHMPELFSDTDSNIRTRQVEDFKKVFEGIHESIPLLCVCGNHDIGNTPTVETIERYKNDFGEDYYSFWVGGVFGVVLNSSIIYDHTGAEDLHAKQLVWFDKILKSATQKNPKHILVFMHHPLFLRAAEEGEDIGETMWTNRDGTHGKAKNSYFHIPIFERLQVLTLLQKYKVHFVFGGHFHQNCVAHSPEFGVTVVTTTAVGKQLGDQKSGFRIVKVLEKEISHEYYDFENMPEKVEVENY